MIKQGDKREGHLRFSAADWLLLVLAVAILTAGGLFLYQRRKAAMPHVEILYTVQVSGVDLRAFEAEKLMDLIPRGSTVYSENGTAELGRVESREVIPLLEPHATNNGIRWIEVPNRATLTVTVSGTAVEREGDGLRIRDVRIAAGMRGGFRLGGFLGENARILSVERRPQP